MAKESERMRLMKENFMELHRQGFTISQIAEKYNLGKASVYHVLQDIADANGISRESLLQVVRTPTERAYKEESKKVTVNVTDLKIGFQEAGKIIDSLIGIIGETLREEKEHYDDYEI